MPNYPYTFQLPPLNVQDIPNDGVAGEFLGINGSGVLDWLTAGGGGTGDMLKADNLSGLTSYPTARTNLGLGTGDSPTFKNLVISAGTLTSDAPVTISQTWNNAAVAFTGLKVNAVSTDSLTTSKLLDLQAGGVSKFNVDRTGNINVDPTNSTATTTFKVGSSSAFEYNGGSGYGGAQPFNVLAGGGLRVSQAILQLGTSSAAATTLRRDDVDHTLALRNGANAQTFNVYGTSSSSNTVYSRLAIACDTSGNATLTTQSTGVAGTVSINGVPVGLGKGNVSSNVAIGAGSLNANTTGSNNLALGANTLFLSTTATFNSALGENALRETTTGSFNVALGASAMQLNSTGASNTAVGVTAGAYAFNGGTSINNTTSSFSLFLGRDTKPDNIGQTNQIVIGYLANGIGSNSVVLGNDSITKTALKGNVGIGTTAPGAKLTVITPFNNYPTDKNPVISLRQSTDNTFGFDWIQDGQNTGDLHLHRVNSGVSNHVLAITRGAGNVGIGTTAPGSALHISGALGSNTTTYDSAAALKLTNTTGNTSWLLTSGVIGVVNASFSIRQESSSLPALVISNLGNVGIGTTSPTSKLHVEDASSPTLTIKNTSATGYSQVLLANTVVPGSGFWVNGSAQVNYGGASSFNIYAAASNIAFHTASVTNALSIAQSGAVTMSGSFSANGSISAGNTLSLGGFTVILKDLGSAKLQILNSAQNVGCTLDAATDGYAKFRLRNSSTVFAAVQGKLTTDTDYTATVVTPTGFLTLYDAQGTAYRVPCVLAP